MEAFIVRHGCSLRFLELVDCSICAELRHWSDVWKSFSETLLSLHSLDISYTNPELDYRYSEYFPAKVEGEKDDRDLELSCDAIAWDSMAHILAKRDEGFEAKYIM